MSVSLMTIPLATLHLQPLRRPILLLLFLLPSKHSHQMNQWHWSRWSGQIRAWRRDP